jgi:hypothetical protein
MSGWASAEESEPPVRLRHQQYIDERLRPYHSRLSLSSDSHRLKKVCMPYGWHFRVAIAARVAPADHAQPRHRQVYDVAATFAGDALKPRHRHKANGMLELLLQALREQLRRGNGLHQRVASLPNGTMVLFYQISDFPYFEAGLLPVVEMCTAHESSGGVPTPDFTFWSYPSVKSKTLDRTEWPVVLKRLGQLHASLGANRTSMLTWRGDTMMEPGLAARTLPREHQFRRSIALRHVASLGAALAAAGVEADVGHYGSLHLRPSMRGLERARASWPDMCRSRYMLHLDGYSYSASLKYRLACGAVVLRVQGAVGVGRRSLPPIEWFEAATPLRPDIEYVSILPNLSNLVTEVQRLQRDPLRAQRLSDAAARYAATAIAPAAVSSYLEAFLAAYATLFGRWVLRCGSGRAAPRVPEVDPRSEACAEALEALESSRRKKSPTSSAPSRSRAPHAGHVGADGVNGAEHAGHGAERHRDLHPSLVCRTIEA